MKDSYDYRKAKCKSSRNVNVRDIEHDLIAKTGDISNILKNTLYWRDFPKVETDEDVVSRLNQFFTRCTDNDELPTVEKMCIALGVTRRSVTDWRNGSRGNYRANLMNQVFEILAAIDAELVSTGKIPQVTYIFRAKNYFDMSDKNEMVITPNNPLNSNLSADQLRDRYEGNAPQIEGTTEDQQEPNKE